jgi:hypothetical protein
MHRIRNEDGTERPTVNVKGGLVEGLDWSTAKHIYVETAVVPIPDGAESYPQSPPVSVENSPRLLGVKTDIVKK